MSERGIIAHIHDDGTTVTAGIDDCAHPLHLLPQLAAIARRQGGLAGLAANLVGAGGKAWGLIDADQIDYATLGPVRDDWQSAPPMSNESRAWWHQNHYRTHQAIEPGLGRRRIAARENHALAIDEGVATSHSGEYAYAITAEHVIVYIATEWHHTTLPEVARFTFDELVALTREQAAVVHYGEHFERVNPQVGYMAGHDAPEESARLHMRTWLGLDPLVANDAIGIRYADGTELRFLSSHSQTETLRQQSAITADGKRVDVALPIVGWRLVAAPSGTELLYPPVKAELVAA